jgi:hypothetical protein
MSETSMKQIAGRAAEIFWRANIFLQNGLLSTDYIALYPRSLNSSGVKLFPLFPLLNQDIRVRWFRTEYSQPRCDASSSWPHRCWWTDMLFIVWQPEASIYMCCFARVIQLNVGGQSVALNGRLIERLYGAYPPNYLTSIDSLYLKIELKMHLYWWKYKEFGN